MKTGRIFTIAFSILLVIAIILILNRGLYDSPYAHSIPSYSGSTACDECHENIHDTWLHSSHAKRFDTIGDSIRIGSLTRELAMWNRECSHCHATGYSKNFNPLTLTYHSTWSEPKVGCEGCHGPGSGHNNWARKYNEESYEIKSGDKMGFFLPLLRNETDWKIDPATGIASPRPSLQSAMLTEKCARCHGSKTPMALSSNFKYDLWQDFLPRLMMNESFYADGSAKILSVGYQSFLHTKMHSAGVSCTDCHDPHAAAFYEEGNERCYKCHDRAKFNSIDHHSHDPEGDGGQCVSCHMPQYPVGIFGHRSDHYIRIPDPNISLKYDIPNACNMCHDDKDAQWAASAMDRWYPDRQDSYAYVEGFYELQQGSEANAFPLLIAVIEDSGLNAIIRATALSVLPMADEVQFKKIIKIYSNHSEKIIRYGAAIAAQKADPLTAHELIFPLLEDPYRSIRFQAFRATAMVNMDELPRPVKGNYSEGVKEYISLLYEQGDRPENLEELGDYYHHYGETGKALVFYENALQLKGNDKNLIEKLMRIYRETQMDEELKEMERRFHSIVPDA